MKVHGRKSYIERQIQKGFNSWVRAKAKHAQICDGTERVDECLLIHGPISEWMYIWAIKACRYYFPTAFILVSTWNDTDENWIKEVSPFVNHIILNDYPFYQGEAHRNYQIKAISAGLEWLRKNRTMENSIVVKLRSDCVLTNRGLFERIKKEIDQYPINHIYKNDSRLFITLPRLYNPYKACDFVMGGRRDDLENFWNIKYSSSCDEVVLSKSVEKNIFNKCTPEEYFYITYAEKIGWKIEASIYNGWEFWKNFFVVLDIRDWGIVWLKNPSWNIMGSWYGKWKRYPDIFYISKRMWKRMQSGIPYLGKMELKDVRLNRRIPLKWAIKLFFGKYK